MCARKISTGCPVQFISVTFTHLFWQGDKLESENSPSFSQQIFKQMQIDCRCQNSCYPPVAPHKERKGGPLDRKSPVSVDMTSASNTLSWVSFLQRAKPIYVGL